MTKPLLSFEEESSSSMTILSFFKVWGAFNLSATLSEPLPTIRGLMESFLIACWVRRTAAFKSSEADCGSWISRFEVSTSRVEFPWVIKAGFGHTASTEEMERRRLEAKSRKGRARIMIWRWMSWTNLTDLMSRLRGPEKVNRFSILDEEKEKGEVGYLECFPALL